MCTWGKVRVRVRIGVRDRVRNGIRDRVMGQVESEAKIQSYKLGIGLNKYRRGLD